MHVTKMAAIIISADCKFFFLASSHAMVMVVVVVIVIVLWTDFQWRIFKCLFMITMHKQICFASDVGFWIEEK